MKKINILLILFVISFDASAQAQSGTLCQKINAIFEFFPDRALKDTTILYPLGTRRTRSVFDGDSKSFVGHTRYYSSAATLPGETGSEFFVEDGKWRYTAVLGPYSKEKIDSIGKHWSKTILACIDKADWKITSVSNYYLFLDYKTIDITVSLAKHQDKATGRPVLVLGVIRFSPLK